MIAEYSCPNCGLIENQSDNIGINIGLSCPNCGNSSMIAGREMTMPELGVYCVKRNLHAIKTRYFRPTIARKDGMVAHWGDCRIFRADFPAFCSCGLNHELKNLQGIAEKLNPKYWEEYVKQEGGISTPEEIAKVLEGAFGPIPKMTEEEKWEQDEFEWRMIGEVFGNEYVEWLKGKK